MIPGEIEERLIEAALSEQQITVLTGAGISAESGIPTFRGPEGYWTVGSSRYQPQEMATLAMFQKEPEAVWSWYLYRMGVCRQAAPNTGHRALVGMERLLGDRYALVTQNVDNLHHRAGAATERMHEIHGNIFKVRCSSACTPALRPLPAAAPPKATGENLTADEVAHLRCPNCGAWLRPHVLWFDECYDEAYFHFETVLTLARRTDLLLIVGTSGATNLPAQVATTVARRGATLIDINIEPDPFSRLAEFSPGGGFIRAPSGQALPECLAILEKATRRPHDVRHDG
jgi:NAD-dependent deacetylase